MLNRVSWLTAYPSEANFILCRVKGMDAKILQNKLEARGILVRYFDEPLIEKSIRITVGTTEDSDILIEALEKVQEA
jgi:histidinol-phosphate aminotransferase